MNTLKANVMNRIGIKKEAAVKLAVELNELLANYQIFYMNVRGFHWNIKGDKFFELHVKFEELYDDLVIKIDEIAERILTLEEVPAHSYKQYLKLSKVEPEEFVSEGNICVELTLNSLTEIIRKQREIMKEAAAADDEGTASIMSDYIREQEKLTWMYSAYIN